MKVYIHVYRYSRHIIALIISLSQNMGVRNVFLPQQGLYLFTLFYVLFLSFIHGFLPCSTYIYIYMYIYIYIYIPPPDVEENGNQEMLRGLLKHTKIRILYGYFVYKY